MADLSPSQQDAVDYQANSVIIAGPGSGKTRVLSHKIAQQLNASLNYQGVVAISYTNKASDELKGRVQALVPGTKESFFGTIDRFYISEIVLPFAKYVLGIKTALPKVEVVTGAEWATLVAATKSQVESLHQLRPNPGEYVVTEEDLAPFAPMQELLLRGVLPLSLVSNLAYITLLASPSCQRYLRARYTHVYIDEYQDADFEQHALFLLLSRLGMVMTAVGDLNQSIFGFANKDARFLSELQNTDHFRVFYLSDNFRCHPSIQNYAEAFLGRPISVHQHQGDLRVFWQPIRGDEHSTCAWINEIVPSLMKQYMLSRASQVAVLARVNSTLTRLTQGLTLPYQFHARLPISENGSEAGRLTVLALQYWMGDLSKLFEAQERYFDGAGLRGLALERTRRFHRTRELYDFGDVREAVAQLKDLCREIRMNGWDNVLESQLDRSLGDPNVADAFAPVNDRSIQLYNLHQSKGLEFDVVVHLDCHDWILPSYNSINGDQFELNQDLNVHYVGLTRAKRAVYLVHQSSRHNSSGEIKKGIRSRFLDDESLGDLSVRMHPWPPAS